MFVEFSRGTDKLMVHASHYCAYHTILTIGKIVVVFIRYINAIFSNCPWLRVDPVILAYFIHHIWY